MTTPLVSLILPIRNEATSIEDLLASIHAQDYPKEKMEILITDGMSTDGTRELVVFFAKQFSQLNIILLDNPEKIVPTGLNNAILKAEGDIIIRVDGHTRIAPDYVRMCVEVLQRTNADNAGGRMTAVGSNPFGKAVALATSTPFGVGGARFHYSEKEEYVDAVYMGAWPWYVFEKVGLFDEELVRDQDDEFNYRLREQGGHILLSPSIRSEYTVRSTPSALFTQYFQYGLWKVRVLQKHPRQMSLRHFVPPFFALSMIASLLLSLIFLFQNSPMFLIFSLSIPGVYIFSDLLISLVLVSRHGLKHLPFLPLTFAILHMAYGMGFLTGMIKFANRWQDKKGAVRYLDGRKLQRCE